MLFLQVDRRLILKKGLSDKYISREDLRPVEKAALDLSVICDKYLFWPFPK